MMKDKMLRKIHWTTRNGNGGNIDEDITTN